MGTATIQLNVRVTPELRADLYDYASATRQSTTDVVTNAIRAYLDAAKEGKQG